MPEGLSLLAGRDPYRWGGNPGQLQNYDRPATIDRAQLAPIAYQSPGQPAGHAGPNVFRKDGVWNVNIGISRRFAIRGDMTLQLHAGSLNLLNHGRTFQFTLDLNF